MRKDALSPSSRKPSEFLNLLLSRDPQRRGWVTMALLGLALMVASSCVILYLADRQVIHVGRLAGWWAGVSVVGLVLIALVIRTGCSRRFKDPSLTVVQMVWTITSGAVAYVFAGDARGLVPSVLAMILFFGALGLTLAQVAKVGLYALVAFTAAVAASSQLAGGRVTPMDVAYAFMVLIVLTGCMALSLRIQRIRTRLSNKRQALAAALAENRELALRDDLTGLLNRRAMLELIALEERRNHRKKGQLVLAMLDLDHFKPINDTHGHAVGDLTLQLFAKTARAALRDSDVLARWGGDEFVLMLADTSAENARRLLQRLCAAVAALELADVPGTLGLTLSVGFALHSPGETSEQTVARADQALYLAKARGRNQVADAMDVTEGTQSRANDLSGSGLANPDRK